MTTSVFDLDAFDRSVRPQDDLFRHVNGSWLKEARIPDDKASTGAFIELRDQAEQAVREIITGASAEGGAAASNPAEQGAETKIALLYASFMDTDRIEELATEPLREDLDAVAMIDSPRALSKWFGTAMRRGIGAALDIDLDSDPGDPQRNLVFVGQSGLGLPDEEYYREEQYAEIREKYMAHVAKMLELAGFEDAAEQAQAVMELETRIAAQHWDKVTVRDLTKMYNPMGFAELTDQVSRLDWDAVLEGMGLTPEHLSTVINAQPSFFMGLDELLTDDLLDAWKSWARWHVVSPAPRTCRRPSWTRTSRSTGPCSPGRRSCANAGSAASGWSTAPWVRPWANCTSPRTSRRPPRRAWTSSWRTCWRRTATRSSTWTG